MKKTELQKKITLKKSQCEDLNFFKDKFIMVKYSDIQLVPKQAYILGFIRGMIKNNQKNQRMKIGEKIWMKETNKRMAFLLGIGESTLKEHLNFLYKKGYVKRDNHSTNLDNTNWYWIDEFKLISDFKNHKEKFELEFNHLLSEVVYVQEPSGFDPNCGENELLYSQELATDNSEISLTIIYNNDRIEEKIIDNNLELENKKFCLKPSVGFEFINTKEFQCEINKIKKLDKITCFNEVNKFLPNGWYDYYIKNGGEETLMKYWSFCDKSNEEIVLMATYLDRILE